MNPSHSPSSAPQSVLWTIHDQGKDADLSFLRTQEVNKDLERAHIKQVREAGAKERRDLADQVDRWIMAQTPETLKAREHVRAQQLLLELKDELTRPLPGQEIAEQAYDNLGIAGAKVVNKVSGDMKGMIDPNIGFADKVVTGAKYVAGILGITWLARKVRTWWKNTNIWGKLGILAGGTVAAGVGAQVIANTTERSVGPRLTPAAPAPSPSNKPAGAPNVAKAGPELVNGAGFVLDGINAKITTSVYAGPTVEVDGRSFKVRNLSALEFMAEGAGLSMHENGDYFEMNGDRRIARAEASRILTILKNSTDKVVAVPSVSFETPDASGTYKKQTRDFVFERA